MASGQLDIPLENIAHTLLFISQYQTINDLFAMLRRRSRHSAIVVDALEGLLQAFRRGHIVDPAAEREAFERHVGGLTERWDRRFPGYPTTYFPYTSFRGEFHRGRRDAYLKDIIVDVLGGSGSYDWSITGGTTPSSWMTKVARNR